MQESHIIYFFPRESSSGKINTRDQHQMQIDDGTDLFICRNCYGFCMISMRELWWTLIDKHFLLININKQLKLCMDYKKKGKKIVSATTAFLFKKVNPCRTEELIVGKSQVYETE